MNIVISKWEEIYKSGKQDSKYPFDALVSYVFRFRRLLPKKFMVLELGCGTGANIRLFEDIGAEYYAIEGSENAYQIATKRYPKAKIIKGDFTKKLPWKDSSFHLVADRSALTHNREYVSEVINDIYRVLKPAGVFIGIDYFSEKHFLHRQLSKRDTDERYHKALFLEENKLFLLLEKFNIINIEHKRIINLFPNRNELAFYDFVVQK